MESLSSFFPIFAPMIRSIAHNRHRHLMALPLAALMLLCSLLMPPSCNMASSIEAKAQHHSLSATNAVLTIHQYIEQNAKLSIGESELNRCEQTQHLFATTWFALPCAERILTALSRSYIGSSTNIALSAPSWMLIFPFNAFW